MSKSLALYSFIYENLIIVGDFHENLEEIFMFGFCDTFGLKSFIKDATWYKNLENPSSIDLILTNNPRSFQNSCVIETELFEKNYYMNYQMQLLRKMQVAFKSLSKYVKKL